VHLGLVLALFAVGRSMAAPKIAPDFLLPYMTNAPPDCENLGDLQSWIHLRDFGGSVILLEWFLYDCPCCQAATPLVKSDIKQYYQDRGGNADGLPVQVVYLNLHELIDPTLTFVNAYGLAPVLDDGCYIAFTNFVGGPTPHFVVINGVTNSSSHQPWEILYDQPTPVDCSSANIASTIQLLRNTIDSVKAGNVPPRWSRWRRLTGGALEFTINAQKGRTNRIECTTNFVNWTTVTNIVAATNTFTFQESTPASARQRFYRVRVQ
jgi:hypothetical protein